jgi:hypothetical protein
MTRDWYELNGGWLHMTAAHIGMEECIMSKHHEEDDREFSERDWKRLLKHIGEDPARQGLHETPHRVDRGRPMRLVCSTLGVARSHLAAPLKRPGGSTDRRKARSRADDTPLLEDVRQVIHGLGTYGYRRVWGVLRHKHRRANEQAPNHKKVYRVMRGHGLLL